MADHDHDIALVLSGGNALGAYQAGAYEALQEHGIEPDWVSGASAGAINGAIICGNRPEKRLPNLRRMWNVHDDEPVDANALSSALDEKRRTGAALMALMTGRPGLFVPRHIFGPWWNPLGSHEPSSLYDATPLARTLDTLVDFNLLNESPPRFCAAAVDIETGEDVVFDTAVRILDADHLRASSALFPVFAPVEINGRLIGDAGFSANLPLDPVLGAWTDRPLLCIAIDLLPLSAPRPSTLGAAASRMQDLIFATQSRRAICAWQAIFDERARHETLHSVTLIHLDYSDQEREVSGKAFDYSAASAAARWRRGRENMRMILESLHAIMRSAVERTGLTVYRPAPDGKAGQRLQSVRWSLSPNRS